MSIEKLDVRRLRRIVGLLGLIAVIGVAGCGDDDETDPPSEFAPPSNLGYVNGDGQVSLSWDASPDAGRSDFAGYNVYRHTESMVGMTPSELVDLKENDMPITTNGFIDVVANGERWFYSVRSVKDNGDLSASANEIDTAARPQGGSIIIAEFSDATRGSGFGFSEGMTFSMSSSDPDNTDVIDIYLGTTDVDDDPGSPLALKSPNLVEGGDNASWNDRVAGLKLLDSWETATTSNSGWLDSITLGATPQEIEEKVIAVKLPPDDMGEVHYGKLRIDQSTGPDGQRQIEVTWAYQTLPNYIRFRTGDRR